MPRFRHACILNTIAAAPVRLIVRCIMIRASKVCGMLCWIILVAYMLTSPLTPDWLMAALSVGFILCAVSAFLLYAFARRGKVPKSKVGLYATFSAVVAALLLFVLPMLG